MDKLQWKFKDRKVKKSVAILLFLFACLLFIGCSGQVESTGPQAPVSYGGEDSESGGNAGKAVSGNPFPQQENISENDAEENESAQAKALEENLESSREAAQESPGTDREAAQEADRAEEGDVVEIPAYSGQAYVEVNGNIPYFEDSELSAESYEYYSELDLLGRCGVCMASIGRDIMPTEERGEIGGVRPSGWHTVKYPGMIDGNYLYNRCHLIGYQLAGENANTKNLITGTRYMNTEGMLPFENMVADYVRETGNHVMYRVTPVFEGDNLLSDGVLMEAKSVEDNGAGVLFNVFCYNVQPGIIINYENGESMADGSSPVAKIKQTVQERKPEAEEVPAAGKLETESAPATAELKAEQEAVTAEPEMPASVTAVPEPEDKQAAQQAAETGAYAVNDRNGKIHKTGQCPATGDGEHAMKSPVYFGTYEEAEAYSFSIAPKQEKRKCGNCW